MMPSQSLTLRGLAMLLYGAAALLPLVAAAPRPLDARKRSHTNDYSCRSTTHPNPVVLLHGLTSSAASDLNFLGAYLQQEGYCTFATTYGAYPQYPIIGGLMPINESALEIAAFVQSVHSQTGAAKVDIVGHSEGAFQTLYVPKFTGVAPIVDKLVAIAPPTHGTNFAGIVSLISLFGNFSTSFASQILDDVGCYACNDLVDGGFAVQQLNSGGPIVQPGNTLTVIISRYDELITPARTAIVAETGVNNFYIQDFCPLDPVGHVNESRDTNVWNLVTNALTSSPGKPFACSAGNILR